MRPHRMLQVPTILALAFGALMPDGAGAQSDVSRPSPVPTATPDRPGIAEVALCQMPELGLPAEGARSTLIASVAGPDGGVAQAFAVAQDDASGPTGSAGCRAPSTEMPDPLGRGETLTLHAVPDPVGDGALDITGTSWAEVALSKQDARRLQRDERVVVAGARNKVLRAGPHVLISVEHDGEPAVGDTINIATDAAGDPRRQVPSTVTAPTSPFGGLRDLYTLYTDESGSRALSSDLSTGEYYTGKHGFAALRDGRLTHFLIPRTAIGEAFRPVSFRAGDDGPPDSAGLGPEPGLLDTDGVFGWDADCIEQLLIHEPLVLDGVEVSYSSDWATFCFGASDSDLDLIDEFIDDVGDDDGVARGLIRFTLREDGEDGQQTVPLEVWVQDERIYLRFPVGLKAYGFHALDDVAILSTDQPPLDDLFAEAGRAIGRRLNPTHFDATAGRLQGAAACSDRAP